ncbi:MAG: hypothetical protein ACE5FR_13755 [Rhodospirillales bacterium]
MGNRLRIPSPALVLAAAMAWMPLGGAFAAPQILGMVATAEPMPLVCAGGTCSAEFSTFCLQDKRVPPRSGTAYTVARGEGLTLLVTGSDGSKRRLPAAGLVRVASARAYMAVTVSVAGPDLKALGATRASIAVGRRVSLVPVPVPGDPWPLSGHDVASATGPLRAAAASLFDRGGENMVAARITNRLINAAPANGPLAPHGRDGLWRRVMGADPADAADPGTLSAARIFTLCRGLAAEGAYSTLRRCLEKQHDALMVETNGRYWQTLGAGS